jgi:uncharacterized OsmC-like protein
VTPREIKELYELKTGVLRRRPSLASGAAQALVRLGDRLACQVEDDGRLMLVDLPAEDGGTARAPHPGQLMRASLGACLAIGYRVWAARLEVPIDRIELTVACDYDARGQLGIDDVAIGWQRITVALTIVSEASEASVRRVVEIANRCSPMLANLSRDIEQQHRLTVMAAERTVPAMVTPSSSRREP